MSLPPFNPRRTETPKPEPGEGDDVPCHACGALALDTGLECSECGADNYEAVTGRPFGAKSTVCERHPLHAKPCERCAMVEEERQNAASGVDVPREGQP